MGVLDIFRRRPPVRDLDELAIFIDEQAAFLVQKGIYEYSRARASVYSKILFTEPAFIASVNKGRWQAFPLGLAMVGEAVEGILRPHAGADARAMLDGLIAVILEVFDRHTEKSVLDPGEWAAARATLRQRLEALALHAPKRVIDVPALYLDAYATAMPIHERLRGQDIPTLHNYLRVSLCNIHDELGRRIDAPAVVAALIRGGG